MATMGDSGESRVGDRKRSKSPLCAVSEVEEGHSAFSRSQALSLGYWESAAQEPSLQGHRLQNSSFRTWKSEIKSLLQEQDNDF